MDLEYRNRCNNGINPDAPLIDLGRGYNFATPEQLMFRVMVQLLLAEAPPLYCSVSEQRHN